MATNNAFLVQGIDENETEYYEYRQALSNRRFCSEDANPR
jgi:hypothetical protein